MTEQRVIPKENGIVWLEDPEGFVYVRERVIDSPFRATRPRKVGSNERMVGYSTLAPEAKRREGSMRYYGGFERRAFTVAPWDPYPGCPIEAVDPTSVRPGEPSTPMGHDFARFTERMHLVVAERWEPSTRDRTGGGADD